MYIWKAKYLSNWVLVVKQTAEQAAPNTITTEVLFSWALSSALSLGFMY
jgi:hypothetical protein